MTAAATFDHEVIEAEDVAVLTSSGDSVRTDPQPEVMAALRYLLYRHELSVSSPEMPQMIAVVGASHGVGVTTVSRSLAEVLASERRSEVCWVDLGASDRMGGSEVGGQAAISRVGDGSVNGQSDSIPPPPASSAKLVPITAGDLAHRGILARPELDDLVDRLAQQYRHVVFDTPPLLTRSDAIGFLRRADAYIMVGRQGSTSLKEIRRMSDELRSIPSLGAVLNVCRSRTPRFVRRLVAE